MASSFLAEIAMARPSKIRSSPISPVSRKIALSVRKITPAEEVVPRGPITWYFREMSLSLTHKSSGEQWASTMATMSDCFKSSYKKATCLSILATVKPYNPSAFQKV